jgi:hypothetical protein
MRKLTFEMLCPKDNITPEVLGRAPRARNALIPALRHTSPTTVPSSASRTVGHVGVAVVRERIIDQDSRDAQTGEQEEPHFFGMQRANAGPALFEQDALSVSPFFVIETPP